MIVCFLCLFDLEKHTFSKPLFLSSLSHVILFVHLEVRASRSHQQLLEPRQHRVGRHSTEKLPLSPIRKFDSKYVTAERITKPFF